MAKKAGGPGNPKRVSGGTSSSMTRKDAKAYKKEAQKSGHGAGNMSVRQIKKSGTKTRL